LYFNRSSSSVAYVSIGKILRKGNGRVAPR
jgi:hypothetical protein